MSRLSPTDFAAHGPLRVGLIGFGCVGQGFYDILEQLPNAEVSVARIAVKSPTKARPLPAERFEFNADALVHDPTLDVLVELIDDAEEAFRLVSTALRLGRHVVTANKAMLARNLPALLRLERKHGGTLLYEAAVAGSIPVLRTLDAHFGAEPLLAVRGILNGSSNYVLSCMAEQGSDYATALHEAQALGFAETDPTLDMAAFDPRSKAVLLAAHAFGLLVPPERVLNLGIENVTAADIAFARSQGQKIKVVADVRRHRSGAVSVLVTPQLVAADSPFYTVEREANGVEATAAFGGPQFWRGAGAGGHPTGSAVLADVLALRRGCRYRYAKLRPEAEVRLAQNLELNIYLRHPDEAVVGEALDWLGLPGAALAADAGGPYATGTVPLTTLLAWRDDLRARGIFVARTGEVRKAAQSILLNSAVAAETAA
jgi:homoserine dehydrogenase